MTKAGALQIEKMLPQNLSLGFQRGMGFQLRSNLIYTGIGSLLFLSIPLLFSPGSLLNTKDIFHPFFVQEFISYLLVLVFFYLNYLYFFPRFYLGKHYVVYGICLAASFIMVSVLPSVWIIQNVAQIPSYPPAKGNWFYEINRSIFLFGSAVFASISFGMSDHLKKMRKDKMVAELSYLKAQINPHFLFNTLNSIYSLAIIKSDLTPTAIVKLSGMMRYAISETADQFVPLQKELNYINSYIDLQKMRLGDTAIVNYSWNGNVEDKTVAPLILIPFIENAFKHGVNPEETSQIDIQISVSETHLYLHVFNLKVPHQIDRESQSGIGLDNGRHQLQYLYPEKHELKIDNNNFSFTVNLKLQLT